LRPTVTRNELQSHLASVLEVERFRDYGPNGLQVEGAASIGTVVSGVTASLALIEAAIRLRADALLVHHGLFWRGHDGRVVSWLKQRLRALLAHEINLFAYHLPLDAHPQWGNNAQLGLRLGLVAGARFGEQELGFIADAAEPQPLPALIERIGRALGRAPLSVAGDGRPLRRIAWCTGGAQGFFEAAIAAGADAYLTGEISEPQAHIARETGVAFIACGHHATERFGVQALGAHLAATFGIEHHFVDVDNPA
jgi:dinuclear metal center YbgI/SA1388 family protein